MREELLCSNDASQTAIEKVVDKLTGKDIVEIVKVTEFFLFLGVMVVCLSGNGVTIGKEQLKISSEV